MITPIILSGGAGTRLWPLSTPERPKQLLALVGDRTMLQMTAARAADQQLFGPAIIVANAQHAEEIERQLREIGAKVASIILEPAGRNTAPAIALAALLAPSDAPMLVMPSDHLISDTAAFAAAVEAALPVAEQGWLVTFGIKPDRAETGYGYIRQGDDVAARVKRVERFVEKPDAVAAARLVADGQHFWNAGIFLFRPSTYLDALAAHAPDMLAATRAAVADGRGTGAMFSPDAEAFTKAPSISIDYAVMEKADRVAVVPVSMGWSDIGSWDALHEVGGKDSSGNALSGDAIAVDSRNCLIRSDGPTVVTVGVEDLIVIATGDTILIIPRGQSQRVKEAVEAAKARPERSS